MSIQFSIDSIEYLAEKLSNCRYLSDESLTHLTLQTSGLISILLQDACKIVRKCCRKDMTTDDFEFALKLHRLEPMYGGHKISSVQRLFRKVKKDNRNLYQIDDNIVQLDDLMNYQPTLPLDISIRNHWLAVNGKQPAINENPIVDIHIQSSIHTVSKKKLNKISHILSTEQQIYFKELTEMCICTNEQKRKEVLLILSSNSGLQQIISRLVLFISEGIRVNLINQSIILNSLMQMSNALLQNETLSFEPYLHHFLPALLSCLLERRVSSEHWSLRDLAAKCCGQIIRKYSTAANRLQQRTINIFYRILISTEEQYSWATQYGALIGLCEMGHKVTIQIVFPLVKRLGEQIRLISNNESSQKIAEVVVKFITKAYRSVHNDNESSEKKLHEDFGSYFAPLIQHQLILLL